MRKAINKSNPILSASSRTIFGWMTLALAVAIFMVILHPRLITRTPVYEIGDIAERDIKARSDFFVEDPLATEESRKNAANAVLTVYDYDPRVAAKITARINDAFSKAREIITRHQETGLEAQNMQPELTAAEKAKWMAKQLDQKLWDFKPEFEKIIGLEISRGAYRILVRERFAEKVPSLIIRIVSQIMHNGVVANKEILLQENEKGIVLRDLVTQQERTVRALRRFYGPDQAKAMVRIVGQPLLKKMNYNLVNLVVDFSQRLIQPNITLNRHETELRRNRAAKAIKPILYQIKAGEMLLREGEKVTPTKLLKLKAMQEQAEDKRISVSGAGVALILSLVLMVVYVLSYRRQHRFQRDHNKNLIFLTVVLTLVLLIVKLSHFFSAAFIPNAPFDVPTSSVIYGIPVATGTMTVCLFLGLAAALPFALVSAICTAILLQGRFDVFLYFFVTTTMAALWVDHCRERRIFIQAGARLGVLSVLAAAAVGLYTTNSTGITLLWDWVLAFMGGFSSGILTAGIAPLMEMTFRYTSDITLLELGNLDRPLLRRLMLEAPGTYHHSVIVGSLVEAAAAEIGANPLLAKVCGYYHDIGKMKKPLYFIENQRNGKNRHDKLAPSMSALILIAHIKDGVELARKNRLGQPIIDTIRQHHGTSLIQYFYDKAVQLKGKDAVNIDDFRYPGPKPQTKEAGLVMLADIVEAASRTLDNPTPARIQGLVQNLINKVFADGQLDNCELTLKDLHKIARSFYTILNGIHHHRIEYSETGERNSPKTKNGRSDRRQAGEASDRSRKNKDKGPGHLKRLGLS